MDFRSVLYMRFAATVVLVPLFVTAGHVPPFPIADGGHELLNAADLRIRELLQLKRAQGCAPCITALSSMNDMDVSIDLESVQAELDAGRADQAAPFSEGPGCSTV
jgi:hypothetical protein